jgi:hypothetical protein
VVLFTCLEVCPCSSVSIFSGSCFSFVVPSNFKEVELEM